MRVHGEYEKGLSEVSYYLTSYTAARITTDRVDLGPKESSQSRLATDHSGNSLNGARHVDRFSMRGSGAVWNRQIKMSHDCIRVGGRAAVHIPPTRL
jgi:hypothetical protein